MVGSWYVKAALLANKSLICKMFFDVVKLII